MLLLLLLLLLSPPSSFPSALPVSWSWYVSTRRRMTSETRLQGARRCSGKATFWLLIKATSPVCSSGTGSTASSACSMGSGAVVAAPPGVTEKS